MRTSVVVLIVMACAALARAETAHTIRQTDLHADSQSDAPTLATLAPQTSLDVSQRRGAWSAVKAESKSGWVRMFDIQFDSIAALTGNASKPSIGRTKNSGTGTTAAEGLGGTESNALDNAQANPAELRKMQGYASSKNVGQDFGRGAKLVASKVPYLAAGTPDNKSSR